MDVFCALTNDDEDNIMSALLAKNGAHRVIALINRAAYVDLVQGGENRHRHLAGAGHGRTLCPNPPRRHVRYNSLRAARQVLEVAVHGDARPPGSVGRRIE